MTWIKLDDQFPDHPKVLAAGPLAAWLYICGLAYASRYRTDGFIPRVQVARLADVRQGDHLARRLVDVGLWEVVEDGYQIHDYLDYQASRSQLDSSREAARLRMQRHRSRIRDEIRSPDVRANTSRSSREVREQRSRGRSREHEQGPEERAESSVALTRARSPAKESLPIPKVFAMTDDDLAHATAGGLSESEAVAEWQRFTTYYHAHEDETRTDWRAQWRTWLQRRGDFLPARRTTPTPRNPSTAPTAATVRRGDGKREREAIGR